MAVAVTGLLRRVLQYRREASERVRPGRMVQINATRSMLPRSVTHHQVRDPRAVKYIGVNRRELYLGHKFQILI